MEKVDLVGGQSRILEVTGRTVFIAIGSFFRVKEVDEQGNKQENKKENQIGENFFVHTHL